MKYHYDGAADGTTGSQVDNFSLIKGFDKKFGYQEDDGMKLRNAQSNSPTRDVEMKPAGSYNQQPYMSARSNHSYASSELKVKKVS
jgi:hypothetical protein